MIEWISELKTEWWVLIAMGLFIITFGRLAFTYINEIIGGE